MSRTAVCLVLAALLCAGADKQLDAARERFHRALQSTDGAERRAALEELARLGNVGAAPDILGEFAVTAREHSDKATQLERERFALERRRVLLEMLRDLAERDPSVAERVRAEREAIQDLDRTVGRLSRRVEELAAWREDLRAASAGLFEAVGEAKRKKAEEVLWVDVERHPEVDVRIAAGSALSDVAGPGAALRLSRLSAEAATEVGKSRKQLAKELIEVRKEEQRLQSQSELNGGQAPGGALPQYERVKAGALALQERVSALERLGEELARCAGRALVREPPEELERATAALVRALGKERGLARLNVVLALSSADSEAVRAQLRALLALEQDPAARAELIDGLTAQGDLELVPWLLEQGLVDPGWRVASRSAAALARLRVKAAVPVLIERLDAVEGRLRSDVSRALTSLTAKDYHGNVELWRRWWQEQGAAFEVAPEPPREDASEQAREGTGMNFFGIRSESQRVLFVLDLSGSMNFSMVPKRNPDDSPGGPPDLPGAGEVSRLSTARQALVQALGGLRDGARFNLVTYAYDVWTWSDEPVEMTPQTRGELIAYVDSRKAEGGTNIYGALARAFDLAGAEGGGEWREPLYDTFYVLTDGKASIGLTTEADEILALARDRNRAEGIVIHTVGLSAAHDANLLRRLAEENGGTYVAR